MNSPKGSRASVSAAASEGRRWARLDCLVVSGIDLHLSLPADDFAVVDHEPDLVGVQPFTVGALFAPAVTAYNGISNAPGCTEGSSAS